MLSTSRFEHAIGYEEDFALWAEEQAELLTQGNFPALDIVNLVDEIQDMSRRYHHSLEHRLTVLQTHLLKCLIQPDHKSAHWSATLLEQRKRIGRLLRESPSLKPHVAEYVADNHALAVKHAAADTHLPSSRFPPANPFTIEQILDPDYEP